MSMRNYSINTILVLVAFVAVFVGSSSVQAQDDPYASIQERLEECSACHGENGTPESAEIPILAGQEMYYLYVQLKDFKAGRRTNEIMQDIAGTMEKSEMKLIAQYLAEQTWPRINFKGDPVKVAAGETAANSGQCVACHLGSYTGASRIPRLAGQNPEYLLKTMMDFKHKVRLNSPAVGTLLASFSDEDIDNMADYIGDM